MFMFAWVASLLKQINEDFSELKSVIACKQYNSDKYSIIEFKSSVISDEVKEELKSIKDEKELEDRFYKDQEFGTGGLRGVIGYGSNRMNVYTVSKATQGFANYLNSRFENPAITIGYDSRNMSKEFAEAAALTLCSNGI